MKKFFLKTASVLMALMLFNAQTFAGALPFNNVDFTDEAQEVLNFNEDDVYAAFSEIDELTALVSQSDATYDELATEGTTNLDMVSSNSTLPLSADGGSAPPLGIPSFLWGCVFGIVGLALVYFLTDMDRDETRKALWGCVIATLIWGVGGFAFY